MNNAESNESQDKQADRAADSPIKTPSAETARVNMSDAKKAESGREAHAGAGAGAKQESASHADRNIGPLGTPESRPRGIDVANDETLDDTVDADGKNIQAKRYEQMQATDPDAVINSNATHANHVAEQGDGFGGFDSRPGRNGILLALDRGYRVIDRGMVPPSIRAVEENQVYVSRDAHGNTLRGRKHYALNHMRPSRLFEIDKS
ncbi:DUF3005 domain-containing protein [Caballeronia sp. GAWG1-1]|uniref:DUF3005 domain-containing protein n=1 Tax=Caballeronia sp. GAWG1-1 TaxID=2921742 RepID=UPI0020286776|nr:DUF3005 domain-containing protein [Caballeronia sp. GAWG1-1]